MQILSEKEFEDILAIHPEMIENDLKLLERQGQLENRRTDLIFVDGEDRILLTELKKDVVTIENVDQIEDYMEKLKKTVNKNIRGMLIGQIVPVDIKEICSERRIEWKEISVEVVFEYLKNKNPKLYETIFIEGKLHEKAKALTMTTFQEYLNETSPFGIPYTSYQFFRPRDASPHLSDDNYLNQKIADQFMNALLNHQFNRSLFNNEIRIKRAENSLPTWSVKAKGAWQGYVMKYELYIEKTKQVIPCDIYLGTIGYRGNKSTFADEKSRFLVVSIGGVSTQYGFHKYINTNDESLLPYFELKFNAKGLPKKYWEEVYGILDNFGYYVKDSIDKKPSKLLWTGNIKLSSNLDSQVGNLIEALFAVTILKAHYKGQEKGYVFHFLI